MGSAPSHNQVADSSTIKCDVCQRQNKTSTAVSYCKDCDETLCQNCDNVHRNSKVLKSHAFLTGDQLKQVKNKTQLHDTENTRPDNDAGPGRAHDTTNIVGGRKVNTAGEVQGRVKDTKSNDNSVPGRTKDTNSDSYNAVGGVSVATHNPDSVPGRIDDTQITAGAVSGRVVDQNNDQSSVPGRKLESSSDTDTVPSVLGIKVSDIKYHNVGCRYVTSVVFMPSGHVVLACLNDGLKLLDKHFKQLSQLSLFSVCACKVSDTEVLVSQGSKGHIQFVEVLPKMVAKNVLTIGKYSRGVCYHNGEIYVVCRDGNPGNGEVRVVQMDGTVVRRLGFHDGAYTFNFPYDVKVNNAGDKVFVSDMYTHSVTCMDQVGRVIYKYTNRSLMGPTGMLVDRQDNVLVTANSDNVHVINKEGGKQKIVLTRRDGLKWPRCISYRHDDGLLAIGLFSNDGKSIMTMKTSLP